MLRWRGCVWAWRGVCGVLRCCSGAGSAVVGGCVGGIATIGLRHAGDTPWRGVYGSKTPVGAGWWLCLVVAGPAVGAWLVVVGGCVDGGCAGAVAHPWRWAYSGLELSSAWGPCGASCCGSSEMSHAIPPRVFQGLTSHRWNCNVLGCCRKFGHPNCMRLLVHQVRGGNCDHRAATRRRHAVVGCLW